uniref:MYC proto-oncogene, bHLH transcription factor a n=1 Tax=Eptatretus burgeri TaxID=7764 RepID=A0A8C4Q6X9_EPTBU
MASFTYDVDTHRLFCGADELDEGSFYHGLAPPETSDKWTSEMLPTPPLSPSPQFDPLLGSAEAPWEPWAALDATYGSSNMAEALELVSEFLDDRGSLLSTAVNDAFVAEIFAEMQEAGERPLRRDCMWGTSDAFEPVGYLPCSANYPGRKEVPPVTCQGQVTPVPEITVTSITTTHETAANAPAVTAFSPTGFTASHPHTCGLETPSDSEEEIDVVTVDRRQTPSCPHVPHSTNTAGVRPFQQPSRGMAQHFQVSIQLQHNYAAPTPLPAPPPAHQPSLAKRARAGGGIVRRPAYNSCGSSGSGSASDSDETERRRTHNILERRRRDGLRSRFAALRSELPDLRQNLRAAKVLILRRAAEHALRLAAHENSLLEEKKLLEKQQRLLTRQLQRMRSSP